MLLPKVSLYRETSRPHDQNNEEELNHQMLSALLDICAKNSNFGKEHQMPSMCEEICIASFGIRYKKQTH